MDVLAPRRPNHPQTHSCSPKLFCQGFQYPQYSDKHSSPSENHCSVYFILMKLILTVPGLPRTRCCTPSWILFYRGFGFHICSDNHCILIFHAYDYGLHCACEWLAPRGPSHPQTLSSSPAFVLSILQYTRYFYIHFSSCFLYVNLIFTVSVDVLAQ